MRWIKTYYNKKKQQNHKQRLIRNRKFLHQQIVEKWTLFIFRQHQEVKNIVCGQERRDREIRDRVKE